MLCYLLENEIKKPLGQNPGSIPESSGGRTWTITKQYIQHLLSQQIDIVGGGGGQPR